MKKRIKVSQDFINKLLNYKKKHLRMKFFCTRFLYKEEGRYGKVSATPGYRVYIRAKILPYILILPFVLLMEFFWCLWNGGLKTFQWPSSKVENKRFYIDDHLKYSECVSEWLKKTGDQECGQRISDESRTD